MLASVNLALLLIFFNLLGWDLSKCSQFVQFVLPIIWKPKKLGLQRQYPHYLQFCVFSSISNFGPTNFLKTGSRKDRNVFNDLANLRIFHRRKRNKYGYKDPYFLCCKTLRNGIEVRQDLYLSVRTLSKLSPFGNLSHRVYCLADFFFTRRRPMNITGLVAGTHRFHDIKTVLF